MSAPRCHLTWPDDGIRMRYTLYIIPQLCCPTLQQALHVFGRVQLASQGAQFVANHLLWAPDTQDWVSERDWERASLGQGPSILYYNREPVSWPPIGPHSPSQASDWLGATLLVSAVAIMTRPDTPCLPGVAVCTRDTFIIIRPLLLQRLFQIMRPLIRFLFGRVNVKFALEENFRNFSRSTE